MHDRECGIPGDHQTHPEMVYAADTVPDLWDMIEYEVAKIHALGIDGSGTVAAINDTGWASHPNLPEPKAGKNFSGGSNTFLDGNGHGNWCIGRVLGRGGVGIAPKADLVVAKVLSDGGSGSTQGINAGRVWAAEQGADIISESLGGPQGSQSDVNSILRAYTEGCQLVVAAAGNSGYNGRNTIGYPGRYLETYCVGSHDRNGNISNFSSGGREIDVATPGSQVISTSHRGSGWATMSGTSMATPFFAGLMLLIIQKRRMAGHADIYGADNWREFFNQQGFHDDEGEPGKDPRWGLGKPKIMKILEWLQNTEWV